MFILGLAGRRESTLSKWIVNSCKKSFDDSDIDGGKVDTGRVVEDDDKVEDDDEAEGIADEDKDEGAVIGSTDVCIGKLGFKSSRRESLRMRLNDRRTSWWSIPTLDGFLLWSIVYLRSTNGEEGRVDDDDVEEDNEDEPEEKGGLLMGIKGEDEHELYPLPVRSIAFMRVR